MDWFDNLELSRVVMEDNFAYISSGLLHRVSFALIKSSNTSGKCPTVRGADHSVNANHALGSLIDYSCSRALDVLLEIIVMRSDHVLGVCVESWLKTPLRKWAATSRLGTVPMDWVRRNAETNP